MLREFYESARQVLLLSHDTQKNKSDIKELRQELDELQDKFNQLLLLVQKLSLDIEHVGEKDRLEREKLALQLRLEAAQAARQLPPGGGGA